MTRASEIITQSYLNGAAGLGQLPAPFENRFDEVNAQLADIAINVKMFGAVGDGVTDDTNAIQAAIDYAAALGGGVLVPQAVYKVTSLLLKPGLKFFTGKKSTLTSTTATAKVINTTTDNLDLSQQVNGCTIDGLNINLNGVATIGIYIYGCDNVITNNYVYGLKQGGSQGIRLTYDSSRNKIDGNKIIAPLDDPIGTFLDVSCIMIQGKFSSTSAGLDINNDVVPGTNTCYDNIVSNNYVVGGTHTVALAQAERTIIENNIIKNGSHRGIILSPYACNNIIRGNDITECGSTCIHLAYGSSNNKISSNTCENTTANLFGYTGESAIQVYVHCKNNLIEGNRVISTNSYGIYVAIHSDNTFVKNNIIQGGIRAGIAVESDWSASLTVNEKYGRPNYGDPLNPNWTSWDNGKGLTGVTVEGNTIVKLAAGNCGLYIAQSKDALLSGLRVSGNTVNGIESIYKDNYYFYVNTPAKLTLSVIENNVQLSLFQALITFTNKDISLISYKDNAWQFGQATITAALAPSGVVDVSVSNNYYCDANVTVSRFNGGLFNGRRITLRLNSNVTVTHNSAYIRLKDDTTVVMTASSPSNKYIEFLYAAGVWFEVNRNF